MAGSDPFKTGNTAFRLGLAKALVPFVFVFSPSLLIVAKGLKADNDQGTLVFTGPATLTLDKGLEGLE